MALLRITKWLLHTLDVLQFHISPYLLLFDFLELQLYEINMHFLLKLDARTVFFSPFAPVTMDPGWIWGNDVGMDFDGMLTRENLLEIFPKISAAGKATICVTNSAITNFTVPKSSKPRSLPMVIAILMMVCTPSM